MGAEQRWREWLLNQARALGLREADAEDRVQEALIAFYQKHSGCLPWNYSDEEEARQHCKRLLKDKCAERRRKKSNQEVLQSDIDTGWALLVVQTEADVVDQVHWRELLTRLMNLLSPRQRQIVELFGKGLTTAEVAVELGISEGAVKSQLNRIRAKARRLLEEL